MYIFCKSHKNDIGPCVQVDLSNNNEQKKVLLQFFFLPSLRSSGLCLSSDRKFSSSFYGGFATSSSLVLHNFLPGLSFPLALLRFRVKDGGSTSVKGFWYYTFVDSALNKDFFLLRRFVSTSVITYCTGYLNSNCRFYCDFWNGALATS